MKYASGSNNNRGLHEVSNEKSMWYESPEEIRSLLAWGRQKRRLLRWVRTMATRRLTSTEKEYLVCYFFECMSYKEIGERRGVHPSSVCRGVMRAIKKLRVLAQTSTVAEGIYRPKRCVVRRRRRSVRRRG